MRRLHPDCFARHDCECNAMQFKALAIYEQMKQNWVRTGIWSFLSFSFSWCITKPVGIVLLRKLDKDIFELRGDLQHNNSLRVCWLALTSSLEPAASVKFQANHCLSVGSVEKKWGPTLRTAECLIYGIVERWCHLYKQRQRSLVCFQRNSMAPSNPHAFTIFASSSSIQ